MSQGWEIMRRSVMALFFREIRTRFGKYQLGYAWALVEPVCSIGVMLIVLSAFGAHDHSDITFPVFLAVGVVVNSLFVEISNRSIKAMEANSALFNYRPIRPIDTVIARAILETVLHLAILSTLLFIYSLVVNDPGVSVDLPLLFSVFILLALFSCGIGTLFMLVTDAYTDAEKVLPLLTRPLFFISGVFFSIDSLPSEYHPLLLWNPIFHAITLVREAVAPDYSVPDASLFYLACSALLVMTLSLFLYRMKEKRLRLR